MICHARLSSAFSALFQAAVDIEYSRHVCSDSTLKYHQKENLEVRESPEGRRAIF
jgi:hypothetical protein